MVLDIKFIKKPAIGHGIHLVVDDGCELDINNSNIITEEQKFALEGYNDSSRGKHLFYLNKSVSDELIKKGFIDLHCPSCGENYKITSKDYREAFKKICNRKGYK